MLAHALEGSLDFKQESITQAGLTFFVPVSSIGKIELSRPAEYDLQPLGQSSSLTWSQGCSSSGFRSRSANRSCRTLFCQSGRESKRTSSSGSTLSQSACAISKRSSAGSLNNSFTSSLVMSSPAADVLDSTTFGAVSSLTVAIPSSYVLRTVQHTSGLGARRSAGGWRAR